MSTHKKDKNMQPCRRRNKRVECEQKVLLLLSDDLTLEARATNISVDGLEIKCNQEAAEKIMPFGGAVKLGERDLFQLNVYLNDENKQLQLTCAIMNMYRLSQDSFCFNLKIALLKEQNEQQLEEFMKAVA